MAAWRVCSIVIIASVVSVISADSAYAYMDPGTGSLIVQSIIGGAFGIMITVGLYWRKVKSFFSRSKREQPKPEDRVHKK